MLKLEMKLNDNRILQAAKYQPDSIHNAVDKAFSKYQFKREVLSDGTICYYSNGRSKDYGAFGRLITTLKDKEWFLPYLDKWLWYNSDDSDNENDYVVEDILYHYTKKESIG